MNALLNHLARIRQELWLFVCVVLVAFCLVSASPAGEVIIESEAIPFGGMTSGDSSCNCTSSCNCPSNRQPPWHGNVAGPCCNRPCCPPPTLFHADPCGQLTACREARENCIELPSAFPRFNGWRKGYMPSPRPPSMPRCHHCGMPIHIGN